MTEGSREHPRDDPAHVGPRHSWRRTLVIRSIFLFISLIALYVLWPSLLQVFQEWPRLVTLDPLWFGVMLGFEVASFASLWALQRLCLRGGTWFDIGTSQLASNALSRIVPGGAATGGALQYKMLVDAGIPAVAVGGAITTSSLIVTGSLFVLPLLSLPAILAGTPVADGLAHSALFGGVIFVLGFVLGWVLLVRDGAVRKLGRFIQWLRNVFVRKGPRTTDLPERLIEERNETRRLLGERWWVALLQALGKWLFDYLALIAALTAVGANPSPSLVLLAYTASMVLSMIPITPGGLGFVEAGLTGLLALAGVPAGQSALAVLAYRLVSFWLPIPAGAVAWWIHERRHGRRATAA